MNQFSLRVGIDVTDDCAGSVNGIKHQLMSAEEVRAEGNRLFAARDFAGALASYDCALTLIAADDADTIATLHSNAAECHLKMDQFSEARSRSQAALDARPMHVKALFRHARACERLGEMAAAAVDVKKILHVEPTHKDATEMLQRIQKSERFSNDWSSIESTAIAVCKSNDTVASWESLQQAVQCFQQQTAEQKTFILSESAIPQLAVQFLQSIVKSESEHLLEALQAVHTLFSAHGRDKPGVAKGAPETLINQVCGCIGPAFQHSNSAVVVAAAALLEQIGTDSRCTNLNSAVADMLSEAICSLLIVHRSSPLTATQLSSLRALLHAGCTIIVRSSETVSVTFQLSFHCTVLPTLLQSNVGLSDPETESAITRFVAVSLRQPTDPKQSDQTSKLKAAMSKLTNTDAPAEPAAVSAWDQSMEQIRTSISAAINANASSLVPVRALARVFHAAPHTVTLFLHDSELLVHLLQLSSSSEGELSDCAAEVVALASSEAAVRRVLIESSRWDVLLPVLKSGKPLPRALSCLALSKLTAAEDSIQHDIDEYGYDLVGSCLDLLQRESEQSVLLTVIEALAFLTLHVRNKLKLVEGSVAWISTLTQKLRSTADAHRFSSAFSTMSYGICQIICNMSTDSAELRSKINSETDELKRAASKGLQSGNAPEHYQKQKAEQDRQIANAGSVEQIATVKRKLVTSSICSLLVAAVPSNLQVVSDHQLDNICTALVTLSNEKSIRGAMIQQGAVSLLLKLHDFSAAQNSNSSTIERDSAKRLQYRRACELALARLCISTDPRLLPQHQLASLVAPLIELVREASHELHQFESLLALTNLASLNEDDLMDRLLDAGAWGEVRSSLTVDNVQIQRAAVECLANMIVAPRVLERLSAPIKVDDTGSDLHLFVLFARSGDLPTRCAASGALANIAFDAEIAQNLAALRCVPLARELIASGNQALIDRGRVMLEQLQGHGYSN